MISVARLMRRMIADIAGVDGVSWKEWASGDPKAKNALEAGHFMDTVPLDESLRADIAYNNAAKLLGLTPAKGFMGER